MRPGLLPRGRAGIRRAALLLLACALPAGGCTLMPKYARPEMPVPSAWPESAPEQAVPGAPRADEIGWRGFFTDERLRGVIELALGNNRDLRVAALNVERAGALYRIQRSELYPGVGVEAGGEITRVPERISQTGQATTFEQYGIRVGTIAWELDFFGRIRSLKESALNLYLATEEARTSAEISLVAAVASGYLVLAADLESLDLARATLEAQQATLDLIRRSRDAGIANDLDLHQARSQVESARVAVARIAGAVAVDRNALDLLIGQPLPPGLLPGSLAEVGETGEISAGLPSEVLLGRPDILTAEHLLEAENADIGAARAAFFPSITLTAGAGSVSDELSTLLGSGTGTWSFIPLVRVPIFAGGALRANLEAAKVERDIAVAEYEKAIQTAFREVSDALALTTTLREQHDAQLSLEDALSETLRLAQLRYEAGIDSYLNVLVAERTLFAAQEELVRVRLARRINHVTMFKVLGGGATDSVAGPPPPA